MRYSCTFSCCFNHYLWCLLCVGDDVADLLLIFNDIFHYQGVPHSSAYISRIIVIIKITPLYCTIIGRWEILFKLYILQPTDLLKAKVALYDLHPLYLTEPAKYSERKEFPMDN